MKKLRVGVLFGGRSGEHEVSLLSAASVLKAINSAKYEVVPIGITKQGQWVTAVHAEQMLRGEFGRPLRAGDSKSTPSTAVLAKGEAVIVPPQPREGSLIPLESLAHGNSGQAIHVDVIFSCTARNFR